MKKRIASLFTSLLMIVSLMVVMPTMSVSAANNIIIAGIDIGYSNGSYFTKNGKSCATMSGYWSNGRCHKNGVCDSATSYKCNCMRYYPTGNPNTCQVDLKASQCWGFARYCEWKVYGFHDGLSASKFKTTVGKTNANSCTESYIKSNFYNIAVASHLRTGDGGHSLSIISTDESGVIWVDCNSDGYCKVIVHNQTWAQFANYLKGRSGISYVYSFIGGKGSAEASSKPGRSAISVKTGTSYKCTTFNWTASSNTKVYSIKIHKNGTLFKENTTAATSWSVILPVGDYEAYVDSCNDSGYTCSNTVKFTIEKGNPVPSSTTVSASAGTNYTPTSISWLKTTNTNEYDVKIWRGTAQKGEAYKILWGEKGTSCLVDLPAGYYEAYVDSRNDYECSMSANIVKFTVTDGNYLDIGDDFYASLLIYKNWLNVTNENGSITVQKSENASARQIWFFDRQSDGSYTIKNCADGSYLDSCSPNGGLAQSKKYSGSNTQKWYIFGRWSGEYYFKPKSVNIVLDVKGNITTGDKVQVCGLNYRDSQKFAIYKLDSYILPSKINLNSGSATIEAGTTKSLTATILPTNSTNKTIIWSTSDASIATVSGGTVTGKKAGTVTITAKTTNGLTANAQIKVVSGHTFGTWTTTKNATCTQVGTKSRKCTVCGKTETQTIAKTGHKSVTDKAIPATCTTDGKTEGSHCSVCGAVIKAQDTIKATGHKFGCPVCLRRGSPRSPPRSWAGTSARAWRPSCTGNRRNFLFCLRTWGRTANSCSLWIRNAPSLPAFRSARRWKASGSATAGWRIRAASRDSGSVRSACLPWSSATRNRNGFAARAICRCWMRCCGQVSSTPRVALRRLLFHLWPPACSGPSNAGPLAGACRCPAAWSLPGPTWRKSSRSRPRFRWLWKACWRRPGWRAGRSRGFASAVRSGNTCRKPHWSGWAFCRRACRRALWRRATPPCAGRRFC